MKSWRRLIEVINTADRQIIRDFMPRHQGLCFLFVRNNYKKGDVVLKQGISTDWASSQGHFALLRGNHILEYMPGVGRRKRVYRNYSQTLNRKRIYAHEIFVPSSIEEVERICKEAGY